MKPKMSSTSVRMASLLVRLAGLLVPRDRRGEWLEEWRGELAALQEARAGGLSGLPSVIGFAVGSLPHAMWMRREGWGMGRVVQDLRYSVRVLSRAPGFTLVAALTLALGIGANSAIFSVIDGLLLKPLPFPDPGQLAVVWEDRSGTGGSTQEELPIVDVLAWRAETVAFEDMAYFWASRPRLAFGDEVAQLRGVEMSHNTLSVLGVSPVIGRDFLPGESVANGPNVAILSHGLWASRFGADPSTVGRTITLDDTEHLVVGVLPESFQFVHLPSISEMPDILTPFQRDPARCQRMSQCYRVSVLGRLADGAAGDGTVTDGASLERAQAELSRLASRGQTLIPDRRAAPVVTVVPLLEQTVAAFRPFALALLGMVALVLLVACINVTNLLLARGEIRRTEFALRGALGASRRRLVGHLLTESVVLGVLGGIVGLVIAAVGTPLLIRLLSQVTTLPRQAEMMLDGRGMAFVLVLSILAGLATGVGPAVHTLGRTSTRGLGPHQGRGTAHPRRFVLLRGLAMAQVASAFVLVVAAGLLNQGVRSLLERDRGFRFDDVLTMQLQLTGPEYALRADNLAFLGQLTDRVRQMPGVESVGATSSIPLDGIDGQVPYQPVGSPAPAVPAPTGWFRGVTPEYFSTMGVALLQGRNVRNDDTSDTFPVLLINEAMALRDWPDMDPVGQRLMIGVREYQIIGVVSNVRNFGLDRDETPVFYRPLTQGAANYTTMVVRARNPGALAPAIREEIRLLAPRLAGVSIRTMEDVVNASIAPQRVTVRLTSAFAALALVLAALGVYGLSRYQVTQGTPEIGVRMALGSSTSGILRATLARGATMVGGGIVVGLGVALIFSRVLTSLLYGVSAQDPGVFVRAAFFVMCVGLMAVYLPARRASRMDPAEALRFD